jgi:nucleoside phosphorylase
VAIDKIRNATPWQIGKGNMGKPRSNRGKPPKRLVTPTALKVVDLDEWAARYDLDSLQRIHHTLHAFFDRGLGVPSKEVLGELWQRSPELVSAVDVDVLEQRLKRIDQFPRPYFVLAPGTFAPELAAVQKACASAIAADGMAPTRKAESWLRPIAEDAGANSDVEATVYFASRDGQAPLVAEAARRISQDWYNAVCARIEDLARLVPANVVKLARDGRLSLSQAARNIAPLGGSMRFLHFFDQEEDFIDATLLRAVQWLGIEGFQPWVDDAVRWLSGGRAGSVTAPEGWALFNLLRADLALTAAQRSGLKTWFWAFVANAVEKDRTWFQFVGSGQSLRKADYVPLAGELVFAWQRIRPTFKTDVVKDAIKFLLETQLRDGAWPLYADDDQPDLLATAVAVHALSLARPKGWRKVTTNAAAWIESQQHELGYWTISGGSAVMLTVLALDAISLGSGRTSATFRQALPPSARSEGMNGRHPGWSATHDFSGQRWHKPESAEFEEATLRDIGKVPLLIVVATQVECEQVLAVMQPPYRKQKISRVHGSKETYFVGRFGAHQAALVQCTMGVLGPSGATLVTTVGIEDWKPRAVLMPGIAFGADPSKHGPADVLIASAVIAYEPQRIGTHKTTSRALCFNAGPTLLSRLRSRLDWVFKRPDGSDVGRHVGSLLSGEKLVDKLGFKNRLLNQHPEAIGGEMEGSGVAAASAKAGIEWALVKGVCDLGDGKKHKRFQEMAAAAAVHFCLHVFQDEHVLDGLRRPARRGLT